MYSLTPLPYSEDALKPVIGIETMRTHHGKHHARYVAVMNELAGGADVPLEDLIAGARERGDSKLFANAAQAWNHAFYWHSMAPDTYTPSAELKGAITAAFGSLDTFAERFVAEGAGHFGSGWVWLTAADGRLEIVSTHDAEQPQGATPCVPLLVCDVWEHAYYLDYKNDRAQYLRAWVARLANWRFAAAQYEAAVRGAPAFRYAG